MRTENPYNSSLFQIEVGNTTAPAPGNPAAITLPTVGRSELLALSFVLTTDANAADRYLALMHTVGADVVTISAAPIPQTAGIAIYWALAPDLADQPAMASGRALVAIPSYPALNPTDTLAVYLYNIQVADTFTTIRHTFKVWPAP